GIAEGRFRKSPLQGNEHGLVILVTVPVDHHQNFSQFRKNSVGFSPDQYRVLQGDAGGQKRLGYAPPFVHCVQAEATAQIAEEIQPTVHLSGAKEQAGGEKRFDPRHDILLKTTYVSWRKLVSIFQYNRGIRMAERKFKTGKTDPCGADGESLTPPLWTN